MKTNLNTSEVVVRLLLFLVATAIYLYEFLSNSFLELVIGIIGIYLLTTVLMHFCMIYHLLGITSKSKKKNRYY